ncbi:DinB family protein [Streptomyces sp. NPDC050610]|uniref:DinB family protein n=1 Tax=Streptomyces sp. NPDC050610 TaxID=3157097 RepID=UPI00342EE288
MSTTHMGRSIPPAHAGERAMLESWLEFQRETLAMKCAGLDDRQARLAAVEPSAMTLLGLVQHMTVVERRWFQEVLAGREASYDEAIGDGFTLVPERGIDAALADWRAEVQRSREAAAEGSLDDSGELTEQFAKILGESTISLRWVLVHMIEEYARHNGHADLIRERIDGVTGV